MTRILTLPLLALALCVAACASHGPKQEPKAVSRSLQISRG